MADPVPLPVSMTAEEITATLKQLGEYQKARAMVTVSYKWRVKPVQRERPQAWNNVTNLLLELPDSEALTDVVQTPQATAAQAEPPMKVGFVFPETSEAVDWPLEGFQYADFVFARNVVYPTRKTKMRPREENHLQDGDLPPRKEQRLDGVYTADPVSLDPKDFSTMLPLMNSPTGRLLLRSTLEHSYNVRDSNSKKYVSLQTFLKWAESPTDIELGARLFKNFRVTALAYDSRTTEKEIHDFLEEESSDDPFVKAQKKFNKPPPKRVPPGGVFSRGRVGQRAQAKKCRWCPLWHEGPWSTHDCPAKPQLCSRCNKWFPKDQQHKCGTPV